MRQTNKYLKTTCDIIQLAYVMLQDRDITDISVVDICNGLEINRSTFYAHFKDLDDLYSYIDLELLELFRKIGTGQIVVSKEYLITIIKMISTNKEFFKAYYSNGYVLKFEPIFFKIYSHFAPEEESRLLAKFYDAAINDFIDYWMTNEPDRDVIEIADGFEKALLPTIRKFKITRGANNE